MAPQDSAATKVGHGLAKALRIKLNYRDPTDVGKVTRGESLFSVTSADQYVEDEPTVQEWVKDVVPSVHDVGHYFWSLFPFLQWITRYNGRWLVGDLIAGITVGAVVVPQGMAYALLANLPAQFGLYASFMGVLIYWLFATSKDITIGPVAVLSTVTGNVITEALSKDPSLKAVDVAHTIAVVGGGIICFLGLVRLGWIVNFISLPAISAYMTGSALNIAVGQVPSLMGITGFSSRDATYQVVINILKHLNGTKKDAAMGLTALFLLYFIRWACNFGTRRLPKYSRAFFYANTLRTVFVILLYTLISWQVNKAYWNNSKKAKFSILGTVPRGFQYAHVPVVSSKIITTISDQLPATIIVMLIEHIAIAKSFGRVNNYTINPSQEMVAIGVTNLLGPFLGAYPATGSFSRTAIKSKAGVRTPFAGVITAIVVLLAIYALPPVFYYIPNASLSAVIIHAVGDLITPPNVVYQFWRVSPLDVIIFFAGVVVTVFTTIEIGIYVTITTSAAVLLWRVFKAQGRFLGRVKVHSVIGDHLIEGHDSKPSGNSDGPSNGPSDGDSDTSVRNIFLPLTRQDGSNPLIDVERPYPGVFIFRFSEGFNYPNADHYLDYFTSTIFKETRRTNAHTFPKLGDRPWNDPGPRRGKPNPIVPNKPTLKAVIIDFSSVNNVDTTSIQNLIDVRNQLDRYTAPNRVDWHFACIHNRWTKRGLASAGFGYPSPDDDAGNFRRWKPIFSVAELGGSTSVASEVERKQNRDLESSRRVSHSPAHNDASVDRIDHGAVSKDTANAGAVSVSSTDEEGQVLEQAKALAQAKAHSRMAVVHGVSRPLFHSDLTSALQAAIANAERDEELQQEHDQ